MQVYIYPPAKSAMTSGRSKAKGWRLVGTADQRQAPDAVMGWISGGTNTQVQLDFDSEEQAIDFAKEKGWNYVVMPQQGRTLKPKSYASNFI